MTPKFIAKASVDIGAHPGKVWDALINPTLIKKYFLGTEAVSDWVVGSAIEFKGSWEGKEYLDKGKILELIPRKLLRYNYLSSLSGLADVPANYQNITYYLAAEKNYVTLTVTQDNLLKEEQKLHTEQSWIKILENLKELLEP